VELRAVIAPARKLVTWTSGELLNEAWRIARDGRREGVQ